MKQKDIFALCDQMRETSFDLHRYLRHGHLEKVYDLLIELKACKILAP